MTSISFENSETGLTAAIKFLAGELRRRDGIARCLATIGHIDDPETLVAERQFPENELLPIGAEITFPFQLTIGSGMTPGRPSKAKPPPLSEQLFVTFQQFVTERCTLNPELTATHKNILEAFSAFVHLQLDTQGTFARIMKQAIVMYNLSKYTGTTTSFRGVYYRGIGINILPSRIAIIAEPEFPIIPLREDFLAQFSGPTEVQIGPTI